MIESWESLGIFAILQIQAALAPGLDSFMRLMSGLGEEVTYILVIPFLYWCIDKGIGLRLFYFLLISTIANTLCKWVGHLPRPYWISDQIRVLYIETGFGAPSGHSQNALGVWLYLAWLLHHFQNERRFYVPAAVLALLISLSRLYLGVHFLHDVFLGWLLALLLLALFVYFPDKVSQSTNAGKRPFPSILLTFILVAVLAALAYGIQKTLQIEVPKDWQSRALAAHRNLGREAPLDPYNPKTLVSSLALLLGAGLALPLSERLGGFVPASTGKKRLASYLLGMAIFFVLYLGLAAFFPKTGEAFYYPFRALRYFLLAFWVIALGPFLFRRLGLVSEPFSG